MTDLNTPQPQNRSTRKRPKITLLQVMGLVILGAGILILVHHHHWL